MLFCVRYAGRKKYKSMESFNRDVTLMFNNCIQYDRDSSYYSTVSHCYVMLCPDLHLVLPYRS